jgi:hypothetical protein
MPDRQSFIHKLTLRLELFTSLIPLPTLIYFISVFGGRGNNLDMIHITVSGFSFGFLTVVMGVYLRNKKITYFFNELRRLELRKISTHDQKELKLRILNYPLFEAQIIIVRWLIGILGSLSMFYILSGSLPSVIFYTTVYGLLFVVPISFIMYLYTTEQKIIELLRLPILSSIHIPIRKVRYLGAYKRIFLAISSVAIIPTSIFSFILFFIITDELKIQNPVLHISVLSFWAFLSMIVVSTTFATSLRSSLQYNNEALMRIAKGEFREESSVYSTDEFGHQGFLIGTVTKSLRRLYGQIKELNAELELKVEERTQELSNSLEILTKLKKQQDGDYYLTSLLLRPLGLNMSLPLDVKVDYITEQYKKFQFQKWNSEIGGDLCRADTVKLRGRNATVFLSADAMGKSIQGAGGALVLGAVFDSLIERTRLEESFKNYYPERWLKKAFIELHKVFESFDGTMLTSVVLGLVENDTGFLYYIDAEHPDPVLYRDDLPSFLVPEKSHRKLGAHVGDQPLQFTCFQLKKGDIFICGSDGRDDLLLQNGENESMNYDKDLFLEIVKVGRGDIHKILEIIKAKYKLTDDISLLSIQIPENKKSPEEEWENVTFSEEEKVITHGKWERFLGGEIINPYEWKYMGITFLRKRDFLKSILCLEKYCEMIPSDTKILLYCGYLHFKLGNYVEAIETAERLRVRDGMDWKNLIHLTRSYTDVGNFRRAWIILKQLEQLQEEKLLPFYLYSRIKVLRNKIEMREKKMNLP